MIKNTMISILTISLAAPAMADSLTFPTVWNEINGSSPAQEASRLMTESISESRDRASHHWLPKLYLDARAYQSNDPGDNFFGLLEQRSLQQSDFNPSSINYPGVNTFERGAIGAVLPLYEGGMKTAQTDMLTHSATAQQLSTSQVQIEQYSQVGLSFGSIGIIAIQQTRFAELKGEIEKLLKNYKLGNKSNPVGYSGLLGIQSLGNRLSGLMNQYEAQRKAYYAALREMGVKESDWKPEIQNTRNFVEKYFLNRPVQVDVNLSYKLKAMRESVIAGEEAVKMEKARFLPQVGAFAETYTFNGSRQDANGYNAGLYLKWNLFDPADYGAMGEAKLKAASAKKYSEALEQQERAERAALTENIKTLIDNIKLLDDSYQLLMEQSKVTGTLFQSGAINALQIVEVMNRRADLIQQQCEAELGLLKAATQAITKQNFDLSEHLAQK